MPIKWLITLRLLLIVLFAAIVSPACQNARQSFATSPSVPQLQVVHTWDDLLRTPLITVGDDTFHLGIESSTCRADSAILVYCLFTHGSSGFSGSRQPGESLLGPIIVKAVSPTESGTKGKLFVDAYQGLSPPVLLIATVNIRGPGPVEIQALTQDHVLLAKKTLHVLKSEPSPWLLLDHPDGDNRRSDEGVERYSLSEAPGMPVWDGTSPRSRVDELPRLFPRVVDPDLQLSAKDGIVTVKSKSWIDDILPNYWLIRWWVNGKPVLKPFGRVEPPSLMNENRDAMAEMKDSVEFQFRLDVDRKLLNAQPNDRLEFQLLYSPDGVNSGEEDLFPLNVDDAGPRLSNIVRWNPGKPGGSH